MITQYEAELIAHVLHEADPKHRLASLSMKTAPLSDDCKAELATLLTRRGYRIEFPVEEVFGKEQHFIRVFAVKTG